MKKVLFDTNVVLDVALKRLPYFEAAVNLFRLIDQQKIIAYITATTITDIYYIAKKEKGNREAVLFISNLIEVVDVIGVDKIVVLRALNLNMKDFEDAVQASAAEMNEVETIITRNTLDFSDVALEIITPQEFVENQR